MIKVLLLTRENCPACDTARKFWSPYLGNGVEEADLDSLPPDLIEQIRDDGGFVRTPQFVVLLPDGNVLGMIPAIPPVEKLFGCGLCGSTENLKAVRFPPTRLCPKCRKRLFRRVQAALSALLFKRWTDDRGLERTPLAPEGESEEEPARGTACLECVRDHLKTASALLNEAVRFARSEGVNHREVRTRVGIAEDELLAAIRLDLIPAKIKDLPEKEKELARWAAKEMRSLRHDLSDAKTLEDLEKAAARAFELRTEFEGKYWEVREGSYSR